MMRQHQARAGNLRVLIVFLASLVLLSHAGIASAVREWVPCRFVVLGSHVHDNPIDAFVEYADQNVGRCAPLAGVSCSPRAGGFITYDCHGYASDYVHCQPPPYTYGDGWPAEAWTYLPGGRGWALAPDNLYRCFVDTPDPKNLGPTCHNQPSNQPTQSCGNPINVATGNKVQVETDIPKLPGSSLEFARTYNSGAFTNGVGIGTNWTYSWSRSINIVVAGHAQAFRGDGSALSFVQSGSDWVGDADNPEKLEQIPNGWRPTLRNNEVELYDTDGKLTSV